MNSHIVYINIFGMTLSFSPAGGLVSSHLVFFGKRTARKTSHSHHRRPKPSRRLYMYGMRKMSCRRFREEKNVWLSSALLSSCWIQIMLLDSSRMVDTLVYLNSQLFNEIILSMWWYTWRSPLCTMRHVAVAEVERRIGPLVNADSSATRWYFGNVCGWAQARAEHGPFAVHFKERIRVILRIIII